MNFSERPAVRTQFLVFTLFGEYVLPRGGSIWTSNLLSLMEVLGVSERAARSTLSRMSRKGWITARKEGRRSRYSLTPRGWMLLKQGEKRIFEPTPQEWDGLWYLVVYSLPEKKRRLRHSLRQGLSWLGFGPLSPGTWVSPHNRFIEVKNMCKDLGVQQHVEIFSGAHVGLSTDQEIVRTCWDLAELEAQYKEFIRLYQGQYEGYLQQGDNEKAVSLEQCFVLRFWLTHQFQSFPRTDPNLHPALLPPDWIGYKARELFENYRALLESHANQYVDDVLGAGNTNKESVQSIPLENRQTALDIPAKEVSV